MRTRFDYSARISRATIHHRPSPIHAACPRRPGRPLRLACGTRLSYAIVVTHPASEAVTCERCRSVLAALPIPIEAARQPRKG